MPLSEAQALSGARGGFAQGRLAKSDKLGLGSARELGRCRAVFGWVRPIWGRVRARFADRVEAVRGIDAAIRLRSGECGGDRLAEIAYRKVRGARLIASAVHHHTTLFGRHSDIGAPGLNAGGT